MFSDLEFLATEIAKRLKERGYSLKSGMAYYTGKTSP
jgi:hypothetical protein